MCPSDWNAACLVLQWNLVLSSISTLLQLMHYHMIIMNQRNTTSEAYVTRLLWLTQLSRWLGCVCFIKTAALAGYKQGSYPAAAPEESFNNQFMVVTKALKHAHTHLAGVKQALISDSSMRLTWGILRLGKKAYKYSTIVALHWFWLFWPAALSHCSCLARLTLQ